VPYGFRRTYDPATGKLIGQVIEPGEAKIIRELFDRIGKGHSLRSIARDFAARNITKASGGPFSPAHLRVLATTHAYGEHSDGRGIRVHVPGRRDGNNQPRPDMIEYQAEWPAIIDRATWLRVQGILSAPERRTSRPGRAKHLLSMIAKCDVCGGPLAATDRDRGPEYQCHRQGCVRISKPELDDLAERLIVAYLARPSIAGKLTRRDPDDHELEAAKLAVAETERELADLADRVARGRISLDLAERAEPGIRQRLDAARARVSELETPAPLAGYIRPGKDVARRWRAAEMPARREVARLLLSPDYLGELRITRSPSPGHRVPVADRVKLSPSRDEV
jgi:hypothetical protein